MFLGWGVPSRPACGFLILQGTKQINGEYRVFVHDSAQDEMAPYAENFAEFLRKRISELHGIRNQISTSPRRA